MGIVVGYLATPEGRAALGAAIEEARQRDTRVVVVVSTRPDAPDGAAQRPRGGARQGPGGAGDRGVDHEVRLLSGGDVADDLILTAEQVGAQLVVLGLRRRSPVGKLILGANAQRVLFDAPCPVLTVKPGPPDRVGLPRPRHTRMADPRPTEPSSAPGISGARPFVEHDDPATAVPDGASSSCP